MAKKLRRRLQGVPRGYRELNRTLSLLGDLRGIGWQLSARRQVPLDSEGAPLPWYTYPAISWLEPRLRIADRVFEYGVGNSTLWYADRVAKVTSVEHDEAWYRRVAQEAPASVGILLRTEDEYVNAIADASDSDVFDIVAVDGIRRSECAVTAAERLTADGLIVFDNSDYPEHREGLILLEELGFARIDFVGLTPGYGNLSCTSVLFRGGDRWLYDSPQLKFLGYSPSQCL